MILKYPVIRRVAWAECVDRKLKQFFVMSRHLEETANGLVALRVRARPGASRNAIDGVRGDELLVSVTAQPEKGKANAAIIKLLAKHLGVARSCIELDSGAVSPHKRFLIAGIAIEQVQALTLHGG